jgi:hypothetical protein
LRLRCGTARKDDHDECRHELVHCC